MDFIEAESITGDAEVSLGRANTRLHGDNKEFTALNEKVSFFDTKFRAVNSELSDLEKRILVNLHAEDLLSGIPSGEEGHILSCKGALRTAVAGDRHYRLWIYEVKTGTNIYVSDMEILSYWLCCHWYRQYL